MDLDAEATSYLQSECYLGTKVLFNVKTGFISHLNRTVIAEPCWQSQLEIMNIFGPSLL
jgi:hypothetical protein